MLLSACSAPEPANPLSDDDPAALGLWLTLWARGDYERLLLTDTCAEFWVVDPKVQVPTDNAEACDNLAIQIAAQMKKNGRGEVEAQDIYLPPIWSSYFDVRKDQGDLDERDRIQYEERIRSLEALGIPTD